MPPSHPPRAAGTLTLSLTLTGLHPHPYPHTSPLTLTLPSPSLIPHPCPHPHPTINPTVYLRMLLVVVDVLSDWWLLSAGGDLIIDWRCCVLGGGDRNMS